MSISNLEKIIYLDLFFKDTIDQTLPLWELPVGLIRTQGSSLYSAIEYLYKYWLYINVILYCIVLFNYKYLNTLSTCDITGHSGAITRRQCINIIVKAHLLYFLNREVNICCLG